jgi:hypothetical protein
MNEDARQLGLMAGVFTFVCAFRSVLPRIDVSRVCWLNTPLNTPLIGRSAAMLAELAWAWQMSLVIRRVAIRLRRQGALTQPVLGKYARAGNAVFALAFVAEGCSWTNLITESNFFAVIEQALWSLLFFCTGIALFYLQRCWPDSPRSYLVFITIVLCMAIEQSFEAFALYLPRFIRDEASRRAEIHSHPKNASSSFYQSFSSGLHKLSECAVVSQDMSVWASDAPWMVGYFSVAVWTSIWLALAPVPPKLNSPSPSSLSTSPASTEQPTIVAEWRLEDPPPPKPNSHATHGASTHANDIQDPLLVRMFRPLSP